MENSKSDGFKGQRSIILSESAKEYAKQSSTPSSLYITDIGYYPSAAKHYRQRDSECNENILIYATDGQGWIEMDGKRQRLSANQFFIIPRNTSHQYGADKNTPWSIYWIHFESEKTLFIEPIQGKVCSIELASDNKIKERIDMFEQILLILELGYSTDNIEYVNILVLNLLASFRYTVPFDLKKREVRNTVYDAIVFMRENLSNSIELKEIAKHVGYSVSHFSQLFREKTNYPPLEYLTQLKMQQASQYLEFTGLTIKEIAFRLGYNDPLYFTKVFNKNFGISPSKFKAKFK